MSLLMRHCSDRAVMAHMWRHAQNFSTVRCSFPIARTVTAPLHSIRCLNCTRVERHRRCAVVGSGEATGLLAGCGHHSYATSGGRRSRVRRKQIICAGRGGRKALQELLDNRHGGEDDSVGEGDDGLMQTEPLVWDRNNLQIVLYPNPILRAKNVTITTFDETLAELAEDMFKVMYEDDGVGLAAPQVGVNARVMVFNETGDPEKRDAEVVLVNPKIIMTSGPKTVFEEGCLSFPKLYGDVVRPSKVRVKAQDLQGKSFFINIDKFPARIFQHEYDHLQGTLFCDRMDTGVLHSLKDDFLALEEAYLSEHPDDATLVQRLQFQ